MAGIYWELDMNNKLIEDSVGYKCQDCGGFFDDKNKHELLNLGHFKPTAKPVSEGYLSFHIPALYAPLGMYDWLYYVKEYLIACPIGEKRDEGRYMTFVNTVLGLTYELEAESLLANKIQANARNYEIGIIPENLSISDGNGRIVLLTCACDLNGLPNDARLDYEVLAWAENGSTYSITHGSIGTFIPNQSSKQKTDGDRERWTYEHKAINNVWEKYNEVLNTIWEVDNGRKMKIFTSGMDTGYQEREAFEFIDNSNLLIRGLKGDKEDKYLPFSLDAKSFKMGVSRSNLYLVLGGKIKDNLSRDLQLKWGEDNQPSGFCNFPEPSKGLYNYNNYFSHFESEQRKIESKDGNSVSARWVKKTPSSQNHLWDCRVYNVVVRDILMEQVFREAKIKNGNWNDFVALLLGAK